MIVNHSLGAAVRVLPGLDAMYLDHKDRIGCNLDFGVVTMFCGDTDTSRRVLLGNWASLGGVVVISMAMVTVTVTVTVTVRARQHFS